MKKKFQCEICKAFVFRRNTLLRHIRILHSGTPRLKYKCPNTSCNREYSRKADMLAHKCRVSKLNGQPIKKEKSISCTLCDIKFAERSAFKTHNKRIHCENPKQFYCKKCKKTFRGFDYFVLHNVNNCPKKLTFECEMCSKRVFQKKRLLAHFGNYHKIAALRTVVCPQCGRRFTNERILLLHLQTHKKQPAENRKHAFECKYCSQVFLFEAVCIQHMTKTCYLRKSFEDSDSEGKQFQCNICSHTFKQKCGIVEHMKMVHSNDIVAVKKYKCSMSNNILRQYPCCDENFIGDTWNQEHVKTEACQFKCRKCKIQFANLYTLLRHCAKHTTKVYQCLVHLQQCRKCDKKFQWKSKIPKHLRSEEDLLNLKCEFCYKQFKCKTKFKTHPNKCKLR